MLPQQGECGRHARRCARISIRHQHARSRVRHPCPRRRAERRVVLVLSHRPISRRPGDCPLPAYQARAHLPIRALACLLIPTSLSRYVQNRARELAIALFGKDARSGGPMPYLAGAPPPYELGYISATSRPCLAQYMCAANGRRLDASAASRRSSARSRDPSSPSTPPPSPRESRARVRATASRACTYPPSTLRTYQSTDASWTCCSRLSPALFLCRTHRRWHGPSGAHNAAPRARLPRTACATLTFILHPTQVHRGA